MHDNAQNHQRKYTHFSLQMGSSIKMASSTAIKPLENMWSKIIILNKAMKISNVSEYIQKTSGHSFELKFMKVRE